MEEITAVSYSRWLELIKGIKENGICSDEMRRIKLCYPNVVSEDYYAIIQKELAKLVTELLQKAINKFQSSVNRCLEDSDLEILEYGIKEFKRNIRTCLFFYKIEGYPFTVRKNLCDQAIENLSAFINEYTYFVKKLRENDSSLFVEDFEYICKKAKLQKYIEEFNVYG